MISFVLSLLALIVGYLLYGRFVEKVFGPDPNRPTPAITKADGVDYIAMPTWKVFMIQFLNIAGTGPIFGAIMGAKFGPASYLWIVFGCIFAGAVHDYLSGMLSIRHGGANYPDIVGHYLGGVTKKVMLVFSMFLLIMVGSVFVYSPAIILGGLTGGGSTSSMLIWLGVIFIYYIVATLLPIDKIIGRIYPVFAVALLFMAAALMVGLFVKWPSLPELWDGLGGWTDKAGISGQPIFPCLFITIACGAVSGFHATQSPIMARCIKNEKLGRPIFYGAMITEGIVALIWAAAAAYFFGPDSVVDVTGKSGAAIVGVIANTWFAPAIATITILGVISAAVTSGDTALRSARLIIADFMHFDQKPIRNRLLVAIPMFAVTALILVYSISDAQGFQLIWRYFAWANQVLATVTLWAITVYLQKNKGKLWYLITLIPALFMTMVTGCFLFIAKAGDGGLGSVIPRQVGYTIGAVITVTALVIFLVSGKKTKKIID